LCGNLKNDDWWCELKLNYDKRVYLILRRR
jgi:hypothetical protein